MKNNKAGFSLIELLIVVVVIGIIAAIAVPGFLASRRSANEGSTISALRILHEAQMTYASSYGRGDYAGDIGAGTLTAFNILSGFKFVDDVLGSGSKSGFNYVGGREASSSSSSAQFFVSAIPISPDPIVGTGIHRFGISTDGVPRTDLTVGSHYINAADAAAAPAMNN